LATIKGKSFRDGLRPPLTAAARQRPRKIRSGRGDGRRQIEQGDGIDSSLDTNRPIQVTDWPMETWYPPSIASMTPNRRGHMASYIQRRKVLATLGGAAAAWPLAARAQQSDRMRRIAVLMNNAEDDPEGQARAAAFQQGLQALGWTEGKNVDIDWHWTAGDVGRIRGDVTELARHPPDIIVANGRVTLSEAVQGICSIPIVFVLVNDPVGEGFISSLGRPGGNVTGFTFFEYAMFGKSLELLKKVAPAVTRVGFIFNPDMSAYYGQFLPAFETQARQYSIELTVGRVG